MKKEKKVIMQEYSNLPYTVIGHTVMPSQYVIVMTGKGFNQIASKVNDEDTVRIIIKNGCNTGFEIIKCEEVK